MIIKAISFITRAVWTQKRFLNSTVELDIKDIRKNNDGSLGTSDFKKMTFYYGLLIPAFLGELIGIWLKQKPSPKIRYTITYQSAMTGLFDDFTDEKHLSNAEITAFINHPTSSKGKDDNERLFLSFYNKALKHAKADRVKQFLHQIHKAQIESEKQVNGSLKRDELNQIMSDKGGWSIVFFRCAFPQELDSVQEHFFYQLGSFLQYGNDIFDVYKDQNAGIQTLVTSTSDIKTVKNDFLAKHLDLKKQSSQLKGSKRFFFFILDIIFTSRVVVCLDHLLVAQSSTQNVFKPKQYSREQLVCDMEKPINLIRSWKWALRNRNQK